MIILYLNILHYLFKLIIYFQKLIVLVVKFNLDTSVDRYKKSCRKENQYCKNSFNLFNNNQNKNVHNVSYFNTKVIFLL